jgi:hypothetical protein
MSYDYSSGGTPYSKPNSTTAVISLIAGILGLTLLPILGSIAALITGYLAKKEIKESSGSVGGDGLATGGIVLGWIGVGLTVIGMCVAGVILLVPLCLIPIGISIDQFNFLTGVLFI